MDAEWCLHPFINACNNRRGAGGLSPAPSSCYRLSGNFLSDNDNSELLCCLMLHELTRLTAVRAELDPRGGRLDADVARCARFRR